LLKLSKYAHNGMDYWTTRMGPLELDSPKLPQNASFSAGQKYIIERYSFCYLCFAKG